MPLRNPLYRCQPRQFSHYAQALGLPLTDYHIRPTPTLLESRSYHRRLAPTTQMTPATRPPQLLSSTVRLALGSAAGEAEAPSRHRPHRLSYALVNPVRQTSRHLLNF